MRAGSPRETAWSADGLSMGATRHWLFARVTVDSGEHGVGEGSGWPKVVETAVKDLAPLLVGEDPRDIERLWGKMHLATMSHGMAGTVAGGAIGALEMALWDLKSKTLGVPLWDLLGGKTRARVPAYAHASSPESARAFRATGYRAFKAGNVKGVVEKVARLRDELGGDVDLMVDLHGPPWLTVPDAIKMGKALEPFNLAFMEEPLPPENIDGYARVRDAVRVPLAAGERHAGNLWSAAPLLKRGLVDVIQPDPGRCGGISQLRKIAALAESCFALVAPHSGTLGPVAEFAALHLMATIPNAMVMERFAEDCPARAEVVTASPELRDGALVVPDAPGLGVDIVPEEIAKHPPGRNAAPPSQASYAPGTESEYVYYQPRWGRAAAFGEESA